MTDQPDHERSDLESDRVAGNPLENPDLDPSGGIGDLGAEMGTAPGQPEWGTRALAPSAGEGLWVG
jgi:hypothetical protein